MKSIVRTGALTGLLFASAAGALELAQYPRLQSVVDELAAEGVDRARLEAVFADARFDPGIIKALNRPAERLPWHRYRKIFLTDSRTAGGVEFWGTRQALLEQAQAQYGVPPRIVTAILGVETRYGEVLGRHRVIDSLSTIGGSDHRRNDFFRSELREFLLLAHEEGHDPLEVRGSYAGAVGMPQFISSSYRAYAVDMDGDGRRDLWGSHADVIGSVANYFKRHGWVAGKPVARPIEGVATATLERLAEAGYKPVHSIAALKKAGLPTALFEGLEPGDKAAVVKLDQEQSADYLLVFQNFYAITRYNHSPLYATAVWKLADAIAARRGEP